MSSMKTKIYYLMEKKNATTWSGFTLSSENAREVAKSIKKKSASSFVSSPLLARERCILVSVVSQAPLKSLHLVYNKSKDRSETKISSILDRSNVCKCM